MFDLAELLPDGRPRFKQMANGSVYDNAAHHIVKGAALSTEQARELQGRRVELGREAAVIGMTKGLGLDPSKAGSGEEWKLLVELFTKQFAASRNLRGMSEAFSQLGRSTGYLPGMEDRPILQAVAQSVLSLFDRLDRRDIIDAEVSDGDK